MRKYVMNIEAYDLDSLRKIIRGLQEENRSLKAQLRQAGAAYNEQDYFSDRIEEYEEYDPDQGARIYRPFITREHAQVFFKMFWGRQDVYAKRGRKGGYFPQCANRWNNYVCPKQHGEKQFCDECAFNQWIKLTPETVMQHLIGYREDGTDVIGVYPLFPDGTCRFLVFDFDNHVKGSETNDYANEDEAWHEEVDALRKMCEKNGVIPLVERSRSGRGAHVWIFFDKPIQASLARNFGFMLLDRGAASVNMKSFHYYDRMYPSQDTASRLGNLIALPLQGRALNNGNSAFVDKNWNAYPDQWDVLVNRTPRYSQREIEQLMVKWSNELDPNAVNATDLFSGSRPKPWRKTDRLNKADVIGKLHIVLADGVYVDTLNLMPRLQNQIRCMTAFDNPKYFQNKRLGFSNYYNFSALYLGKDVDGYIRMPRGMLEELEAACDKAGIEYDTTDHREKGRPIRVKFNGSLKQQQDLAAQKMLEYDNGVLSAATAFGKTVVCSYLIAERKVNCLILMQSKDLLNQWVDELEKFLDIDEEPPEYTTKTGRVKKRDSVIGVLHGSKKALTGIVDVAMVGSVYAKGQFNELINSYGMVIMDECHHAAASTAVEVLQKVNARYVYGVSATIKRSDELEKMIPMLIGPMRHSYTSKQRAVSQGIGHYVFPRFTRTIDTFESRSDINQAFTLISKSVDRNQMIISDVKQSISDDKTPVILTRYKEHAKYLYDNLREEADHVFLIYGDNSDKENSAARIEMKGIPDDESMILVATGQKIGEGFDMPRLDTLMLASPVSSSGSNLEQYVGRLNRDYEGKKEIVVYDYVDSHIRYFNNMYVKRLNLYKKIGFSVIGWATPEKQQANAIYDAGNYSDTFEQDVIEADRAIVISSPVLLREKVNRFIYIVRSRQEAGVKITVITTNPDRVLDSSSNYYMELINTMTNNGINVIPREEVLEHFAVIDDEIVWHGGVNLLGSDDIWDNLIRIKSPIVAAELLELALGDDKWESWDYE